MGDMPIVIEKRKIQKNEPDQDLDYLTFSSILCQYV